MNLTKLEYFITVCSVGSLSAAGEYLHISQPSLSSVIKELEREYGVSLFKRHKGGMKLTREGEALLRISLDLVERAKSADEEMRSLGKERRRLTLGVPPMIGSLCLPKIYGEFVRDNPDIAIKIFEGGREELLNEMRCERLDCAILPHDAPIDEEYSPVRLGRLETVFATYKSTPVLNFESVSPEDLIGVDLVLFEDGFFNTEKIKKWFMSYGVEPKILMQTTQLSTIVSMVRNKTAVGCMFRELVGEYSELTMVPLSEPMMIDVSFISKRDAPQSDAQKRLCQFLVSKNMF